jgi:DnaK suppressor protein
VHDAADATAKAAGALWAEFAGALRAEQEATRARLAAMTGEVAGIMAASLDANADDEHDPEGATIAFERARVSSLVDAARAYLRELDAALGRLEVGTYGRCARCASLIAPERLAALPATRACITCAGRG